MTRKMSEIMKRLEAVEAKQARQDTPAAPSCVFLSSGDYASEEDRESERARLAALYGDRTRIILFDLVGPKGTPSPIWKGDPPPSIEEFLASDEYRRTEKQYFKALVGTDPSGVLKATDDSTLSLLAAGVIARGPPADASPEDLSLYEKAKQRLDRERDRETPLPSGTARQTSMTPLPAREDTPREQLTNVKTSTVEREPDRIISGGGVRRDDSEPDFQHMGVAGYERLARNMR